MNTLRQLLECGQYELAAHRLVYGAVQAHLHQRDDGANEPAGELAIDSCDGRDRQPGGESDGQES